MIASHFKNIILAVIYSIFLILSQQVLVSAEEFEENDIVNRLVKTYSEKNDIEFTDSEININRGRRFNKTIKKETISEKEDQSNSEENNSKVVKSELPGIQLTVEKGSEGVNVDEYLNEAYKAYQMGYYEVALKYYKKVEDMDPINQEALFGIAVSHHKLGHFEHAKRYYIDLLESDPENKFALNNFLAILSYENPDYALTTLRRLEAADPDLSIIPAQIAIIYERQKDYKNAIKYFKKANKLEPSNLDYLYNIAILFEKTDQKNNAMILYNKIIEAISAGYKSSVSFKEVNTRINNLNERIHSRLGMD